MNACMVHDGTKLSPSYFLSENGLRRDSADPPDVCFPNGSGSGGVGKIVGTVKDASGRSLPELRSPSQKRRRTLREISQPTARENM